MFFDRRSRHEGRRQDFWAGALVRIFRIDAPPDGHSYPETFRGFFVETMSRNYEGRCAARDLTPLSPLEQLAEQADD